MPDLKDRSDESDRALARRLAPLLRDELRKVLRPFFRFLIPRTAQGIRVLSPLEVAEQVGCCVRHLARLEASGKLPRRRRISKRRIGYLSHAVDQVPVSAVVVEDARTLSREAVAAKLGVTERTVKRMARKGELPAAVDGRWFERDLDQWLLKRPKV